MTNIFPRKLVGVYATFWKDRRLAFQYRQGRWDQYEVVRPWDIREAIHETLERLELASPGTLAKAAALDDKNWLASKRRTRRYIADRPELLYIDSPHLIKQSEAVMGFYAATNLPWRQVPDTLRLACQAAGIPYGSFSALTLSPPPRSGA